MPFPLAYGRLGMHDHHDSRDVRYSLFQYLKALAPDRTIEAGKTGDVAARMSEARDEPIANWIAANDICETAMIYSITSSAATSNLLGTVRPSILAVWWLMTSSNFDACTTGKSAGLMPLRMRAV